MEHKYVLIKKADANEFTIRELAETDNAIFTMLSESTFPIEKVEEAMAAGTERLIELIRSNDFFPSRYFCDLIVEKIRAMFGGESLDTVTIECSDREALSMEMEAVPELVEVEKEVAEIDKLLEDDDIFEEDGE